MNKEKQSKHMSRRSGFTMIEIILVVVIIGILAGIAVPRMGGKTEKAKLSQASANITALGMAIQEYEIVNGDYPSSLEGLLDESKGGPFMEKKSIPTDPWGAPFTFAAPGSHNSHTFDLSCTSPKGTLVNNWE
ncbi:type II secretion system protein GspG [Pontiella sulfatireligans]|uniref:Type II secretion system protein G n=1 Tax=Pontiella sulfatireligans TaxID=2750658 RepID=A0A6C2UGU7_9BACT|nr:type II secretion system protein GspG [Pontiella sulfatireligans]VGO19432.1 Type II secretion system protein G [Pontiella sulfatireligans]